MRETGRNSMMYFTLLIYTNILLIKQHKKELSVERITQIGYRSLTIKWLLTEWLFSMDDQPRDTYIYERAILPRSLLGTITTCLATPSISALANAQILAIHH